MCDVAFNFQALPMNVGLAVIGGPGSPSWKRSGDWPFPVAHLAI